ncbi:MAG TPA: SDR family oxidoreductase [Vicinamibacterales bacterium]|nr:SDR family oxidoreductase [Vicinamibacterales bacterium]
MGETLGVSDGPTNAFDVSGRAIIVTGAAGLLGREYARALVAAGASVVLADINESRVTADAADLRGLPGTAIGVGVDITDEASVSQLARTTLAAFGRIDGLVNNAALNPAVARDQTTDFDVPFEEYSLDLWNRTLAVNLTGMFLCARAVAPTLLAQQHGAIVNVSSTYGLVGPDQRLYDADEPDSQRGYKPVAYSVTKSGVLGFTRYLAAYWAGTGIRVNTLTPGGVLAEQPDEFVRRYSARTVLGRMADRHEYSAALLFLLSDASSYMTGSNLVVDGGWTAW